MRKHLVQSTLILFLSSIVLFAQDSSNVVATESSIDWFEILIVTGYLLGVFILLPVVIYTNLKEKLFSKESDNQDEIKPISDLTEQARNDRSALILQKIEEQLTAYQSEEGENLVTITSGKQARFTKHALDYINKKLIPTHADMIARVDEFSSVYVDRTKRAFTGSKWIIFASAAVGVLFYLTGGISTFLFIHFFGLLFYILASRTTFYALEKRMDILGRSGGMIGSILSGLLVGNGVKYYVSSGGGYMKRDWETEGQMALIGFVIMAFIALLLGVFTALLGVFNSVLNYSTSYIIPFKSDDDWFEKNF